MRFVIPFHAGYAPLVLRWLPNCVTAARGLAGPAVVYLLLVEGAPRGAFVLFAVAAFTDLFDGWLAARLHSDRRLGQLLDPIADKVLAASTWAGLWAVGWAPTWLPAGLILRDAVVAAGWLLLRRRGVRWTSSRLGQVATSFEGTSLGILLFHGPWLGVHWPSVGVVVGGVGLALSVASAAGYAVSRPPEVA